VSNLTDRHIAVLRALVDSARTADCDVGMDVTVLAALLNERENLREAASAALALFRKEPSIMAGVVELALRKALGERQ
jgi:hypothetical protein